MRHLRRLRRRITKLYQWPKPTGAKPTSLRPFEPPAAVQRHLDTGLSRDKAIYATALDTEAPLKSIRIYWKNHRRAQAEAEAEKTARTIAIMKMAKKGYSNGEIGKRLSLHPGAPHFQGLGPHQNRLDLSPDPLTHLSEMIAPRRTILTRHRRHRLHMTIIRIEKMTPGKIENPPSQATGTPRPEARDFQLKVRSSDLNPPFYPVAQILPT